MKSKNKKRTGKWVFTVILVLILCCAAALTVLKFQDKIFGEKIFDKPAQSTDTDKKSSLEKIALNTSVAEISYKDGILKADAITPSLDTCTLKTTIYDLKGEKILGEANLDDAAWVTGLTKNGFYALDILNKTAFLYDRSGRQILSKTFAGDNIWSYAAAFSYDEKYIVYNDPTDSVLHIYDRDTENETTSKTEFSIREILNFEDNTITVLGVDGQTARISIKDFKTTIISNDKQCSYKSQYYSIGMTENNFKCCSAGKTVFIPFESIDEIVVGMDKNAFATTTMQKNGTLIRIYSLNEEKIYEAETAENVESIIFADNKVLALNGNCQEEKHNIAEIDYKKGNVKSFKTLSGDTATEETPQTSEIKTAKPASTAKIIKNVPLIKQFPEYPTGCESVSTVMAMQYMGDNITVKDFVSGYLPQSSEFYISEGKKYGPSPYEVFIGTPTSNRSYGCMATVIESSLKSYYGNNAEIINATGTELPALCESYINNDMPVIIWATVNMVQTESKNSWYLADGTRFTWPGNEHCLLLVGFDSKNYYFNDPYSGKLIEYKKSIAESRYKELGMQSIIIKK